MENLQAAEETPAQSMQSYIVNNQINIFFSYSLEFSLQFPLSVVYIYFAYQSVWFYKANCFAAGYRTWNVQNTHSCDCERKVETELYSKVESTLHVKSKYSTIRLHPYVSVSFALIWQPQITQYEIHYWNSTCIRACFYVECPSSKHPLRWI